MANSVGNDDKNLVKKAQLYFGQELSHSEHVQLDVIELMREMSRYHK